MVAEAAGSAMEAELFVAVGREMDRVLNKNGSDRDKSGL